MKGIKYIHVPDDWTAEQAWAVLDFIHQLENLVWDTYEAELREFLGTESVADPGEPMDDMLGDDIPF